MTTPQNTSRRRLRNSSARLGRTQELVLHLLADRAKTVRMLAFDWPGLTESSARGAIERLAMRGLVDLAPAEYDNGRFVRAYTLTENGAAVQQSLLPLDDEDGTE